MTGVGFHAYSTQHMLFWKLNIDHVNVLSNCLI